MVNELSEAAVGLLAIAGVLLFMACIAATLHWGREREHGLLPFVFYPVVLIVSLSVLFSGRNLDMPTDMEWLTSPKHPLLVWAGRAASVFVVLASGERLLRRLFWFGPAPPVPSPLLLALLFYCATNVIAPALFGTIPSISHDYLYTVLVACAALLTTREEGLRAIASVRNVLLAFLILSALSLLWRPELVLIPHYAGLIPGLDVRYSGLALHPNGLGPLAAIFLLCLWKSPFRLRWLNAAGWVIGTFSFIMAQSKTNWIAFLVCALVMILLTERSASRDRLSGIANPTFPAAMIVLAMLFSVATSIAVMFGGLGEAISDFFDSNTGADLLTFMGRWQIWEVAVNEWRNSPVFGYGLTIWDDAYRASIGIPEAFQAHNQFFQSLASSGTLGAVGLVGYVIALLVYSLKTASASGGLSVSLFLLLVMGSVSEVPLAMTGLGPDQVLHLLLLMVIASHCDRQSAKKEALPRGEFIGKEVARL